MSADARGSAAPRRPSGFPCAQVFLSEVVAMGLPHQRVTAALELREPDMVPTFDLFMETSLVYRALGKKPPLTDRVVHSAVLKPLIDKAYPLIYRSRFLESVLVERQHDIEMENFVRSAALAAVKLGFDSACVAYYPVYRIKDSRTVDDIFGRRNLLSFDRHGYLELPVYREGLIRSPDDWSILDKRPILSLPQKAFRVYSALQKDIGGELFVFGLPSQGLYENTWQPMGFERFVVALRTERSFVERVVRFYADLICEGIEALSCAGIPGVLYADDLAHRSGPMLNPRLLDELFGDHYRRITETARSLGMKIVIHSCGNVMPLLEWLADCGFDGVQSLEPTAGVDLAEAKRAVGSRMCLIGNIDVSRVLVSAAREEVFESVRGAIMSAGAGGGFILSAAHTHSKVSLERVRWMLEAARAYGTYPLGQDRPRANGAV